MPAAGDGVAAERVPASLAACCVCPACRARLIWSPAAIACSGCGHVYRYEAGIPIFTSFDEGSTLADVRYKLDQAEFFDAEGSEWEIARPRGPALYGRLMIDKFRRSIRGLEDVVPGATVLAVCGGSGMDAEFLARAGAAAVIVCDISLGAAQRARERARREGLAITSVVADLERLPFADRSVAMAYVHDGLHHLNDPELGLSEMLRVAENAVSVTEPARATVTRVAVRLGLAQATEEAGNRVERIDPRRVAELLRSGGFRLVGSDRYAMYYRHVPGPVGRLLSRRRLVGPAAGCLDAFNRVLGPIGNKSAVRAVRADVLDRPQRAKVGDRGG